MKDLSNRNIIHINKGGINYIQFRRLLEYSDVIQHCFTLKPLDFGTNNNFQQEKKTIEKNYEEICEELQLNNKYIIRPLQTHTNNVTNQIPEYGVFPKTLQNVDGLITNEKNKVLSLTFADCTPLIFFDPDKKIIANVHSGWRGTANKIGAVTLKKMIELYQCDVKKIICCIGPTIRQCHFEVEDDVKELFEKNFNDINEYIMQGVNKDKYLIDTVAINRKNLEDNGMLADNIVDSGICTFCDWDLLHSYRKEKEHSGRATALITLI